MPRPKKRESSWRINFVCAQLCVRLCFFNFLSKMHFGNICVLAKARRATWNIFLRSRRASLLPSRTVTRYLRQARSRNSHSNSHFLRHFTRARAISQTSKSLPRKTLFFSSERNSSSSGHVNFVPRHTFQNQVWHVSRD